MSDGIVSAAVVVAAGSERRAFQVLHLLLGAGLMATGVETLVHALRDGGTPLAVVAAVTVVAAALFLVPRTVRLGGAVLLLVVLATLVERVLRGQWRLDLMVFAAGIWLVAAHGAAWGSSAPHPDASAPPAPAAGRHAPD